MADKILKSFDVWIAAQGVKSRTRLRSVDNISLEGIARFRELILEFAIRGKLVPQEGNDEPASVLLKRIENEKEKLIKEKKIPKDKNTISSADEEFPFELPKSWKWTQLAEIGFIFNGNSINANEKEVKYSNTSGYPFIATKDVGYGWEELDYNNGVSIPFEEQNFKVAKKGAVLICAEGGSAGKKCGITNRDICFGNKLFALELFGGINGHYLLAYYQTPSFFDDFHEKMTGIIGGISLSKFSQIKLPLPPLPEQHRIVAKVEELMALCDELEKQETHHLKSHALLVETLLGTLTQAKDAKEFQQAWKILAQHFDDLFTTEDSIDQLKQTILQLAVMGKLVPQDPKDLPAPAEGKFFVYVLECSDGSWYKGFTTDILKRWKEHAAGKGAEHTKKFPPVRLMHWEEFDSEASAVKREQYFKSGEGRAWLKQNEKLGRLRQAGEPASVLLERIKKDGIGNGKRLQLIDENEKPFIIPKEWSWVRLGDILRKITDGTHHSPPNGESGDYLYISAKNIKEDGVQLSNATYVSAKVHQEIYSRCDPEKGDVLYIKDGATTGIATINNLDQPFSMLSSVALLKVPHGLENTYLLLSVRSPYFYKEMREGMTGVAITRVTLKKLNDAIISLPPLAEQRRIVSKVNELFALCDGLKARLAAAQTLANELAEGVVSEVN